MWKDFFYYTRNEQRGIVILLILIVIVVLLRIFLPFLMLDQEFSSEEMEFLNKINAINQIAESNRELEHKDSLFVFNPNEVTKEEMILLGLNSYQIKSLIGYRTKVDEITCLDDLKKVYGVDSFFIEKYSKYLKFDKTVFKAEDERDKDLLKWINLNHLDDNFLERNVHSTYIRDSIRLVLKDRQVMKMLPLYQIGKYSDERLLRWIINNSEPKKPESDAKDLIDLNIVDTLQLQKIKGIGSVLSNRIIKYRKLLGGFVRIDQLKEVYGLSEKVYEASRELFIVNTTKVKKIKLSARKIKEISKHPYFTYEQCIELMNLYRKGVDILNLDASELNTINEHEWGRMRMYLEVD